MRIFLAGVSCVGKTTIGARLAGLLEYRFFDLDVETERFFGTSIERLRNRHLTSHDFRLVASQALKDVLSREDSCNCVIALPPSGLLGGYWKVVNETRDATIVVLRDTAENILGRITFYLNRAFLQKSLLARAHEAPTIKGLAVLHGGLIQFHSQWSFAGAFVTLRRRPRLRGARKDELEGPMPALLAGPEIAGCRL